MKHYRAPTNQRELWNQTCASRSLEPWGEKVKQTVILLKYTSDTRKLTKIFYTIITSTFFKFVYQREVYLVYLYYIVDK